MQTGLSALWEKRETTPAIIATGAKNVLRRRRVKDYRSTRGPSKRGEFSRGTILEKKVVGGKRRSQLAERKKGSSSTA